MFSKEKLQSILFGLLNMFPHDPFTQIRIFQSQRHDNLPMTIQSPSSPKWISKGILPISQYIFSYVDQ